jgi:hypothetical protein
MSVNRLSRVLWITCLVALAARPAFGQYPFGKNKVIYAPKAWVVIETPHFDIYYYPDERGIAEFVASISDSLYAEYADFFSLQFKTRIPVVLYGTHHDFKETNVIPYLISESTGGFTEFIKGRIALPFLGSYAKLEHVFRHEVTHAFMIEKLRVVMAAHRHFTYSEPPLWFSEGLAEYLASGQPDSEAQMFLRDAVANDLVYALDEMWRIEGSYLMYKEGESAVGYLATRFGRESIRLILENWWRGDRFDTILQHSIGLRLHALSDGWREYLKRRYWPAILDLRPVGEVGEAISPPGPALDIHPVTVETGAGGTRTVCVGYDRGSINILDLVRDDGGRWHRRILIRGGQRNDFESIPLLRSRLSARGDTLLFVSKAGARDAIYLFSVGRKKVLAKITTPIARILSSPCLSPDGSTIAFSAIDGFGKSDLFLYDLATGTVRRLTDDYYEDVDPDWRPDGRALVFSSDRCGDIHKGTHCLETIDVETGEIEALTDPGYQDTNPRWLRDGSGILFASDRRHDADIYLLRDGRLTRQTNVLGGALDPWPCLGDSTFLAAAYTGGTFRIYRMKISEEAREIAFATAPPPEQQWTPPSLEPSESFVNKPYRPKFGLDLIGATFTPDPDYGSLGSGAQLFFTDVLGNHQIAFLFGSASDNFDEFFKKLNVAFTYVNLTHRLNYAVGAFHLASYVGYSYDLLRFERWYGGFVDVSYPLSTFTRIDLSTVVKGIERDDEFASVGLETGRSWLISNYISATFDNIVWYVGGPSAGRRVNVALGSTIDMQGTRYGSTTLHLDLRNYVGLSERIVFAQRLVSRNAWGGDLQLFYLGGAWDLRGYRFREFAGKRTLLLNNELRFPLLDRLLVKLPFGVIDFPLFRGSLFFDVGRVNGFIYDTDWLGSFGAGVEMNLGYLPVARVNFSRLTDFKTVGNEIHVDFFLGFNF